MSFLHWGIATSMVDMTIDDYVLLKARESTAVVSFVADYRRNSTNVYRGIMTCVSFIKAVLGLQEGMAITPRQLYKYLLSHELATVVKPYTPWYSPATGGPNG